MTQNHSKCVNKIFYKSFKNDSYSIIYAQENLYQYVMVTLNDFVSLEKPIVNFKFANSVRAGNSEGICLQVQ